MSILVYIDHAQGNIKKSSLEALSYAQQIAAQTGDSSIVAVALGSLPEKTLSDLGNYGAKRVLSANSTLFDSFDSSVFTKVLAQAVQEVGATWVIFSHNSRARAIAPRLSARLQAGLVTGVVTLPTVSGNAVTVRRAVFSGKAFADYQINTPIRILSLNPNALPIRKVESPQPAEVTVLSVDVSGSEVRVQLIETKQLSGNAVPLTEAEIVVSAGRGMKGPENWNLVEDLATALGATTACSRPVADVGWRPHHEHVGQTGITIRPNLYVAVGISGAIQHLAGVNNSKVIVVINKDPEAPFFKAADYGIVGDAFEILPKITAAVKALKSVVH